MITATISLLLRYVIERCSAEAREIIGIELWSLVTKYRSGIELRAYAAYPISWESSKRDPAMDTRVSQSILVIHRIQDYVEIAKSFNEICTAFSKTTRSRRRTRGTLGRSSGRHQSLKSLWWLRFGIRGRGCRVTEISTEAETRGERASERALEFSRRPFDLFEPLPLPLVLSISLPPCWSAQTRRYRPARRGLQTPPSACVWHMCVRCLSSACSRASRRDRECSRSREARAI